MNQARRLSTRLVRAALALIMCGAALGTASRTAGAEALLLVEADTGKVLHAENATYPWYPASVTKLMTAYTALRAVKDRQATLDTLLTMSPAAAAQQPTKMGFPVGTTLTLDNALKMLMVKSANDVAVAIAEGIGGSVDGFADKMNENAARLGMTQSHFVNPNGLPAENHVTSARDLAILARALIREFPAEDSLWHISGIRYGKRVMRNYNSLIDRYPGADGMKTGFICASGYNLVASATRNGKRLIAVVLGAYGGASRAQKAAQLLERGFGSGNLSWLTPSLGTVDALQPINASPPDLREEMCGKHRRKPASEDNDEGEEANAGGQATGDGADASQVFSLSAIRQPPAKYVLAPMTVSGPIIDVYTGSARNPTNNAIPVAVAKKRGKAKHAKVEAKADAKADAKPKAKEAAKPAAKSDAKSDTKPASKPAAKPAAKKKKTATAQ
ncbi:MAG: peptidase M15 [Rhizobiales bacterium 64-17]|nr:MAG: peptidase M15 [Rhizobiales bacterium 64-17]